MSRLVAEVLARLQRPYWSWIRLLSRGRRALLVTRLKARARMTGSTIELDIAPDVVLGPAVRVEFVPGTHNRLVVGPGVRLQEGVVLWLLGGTIEIGADTVLRRRVLLNSSGRLVLGRHIVMSWGAVVHCTESVLLDDLAGIGEYSTITDSVHARTPVDVHVLHHVRARPTRVGKSVWIGAHALIGAGVDVGDGAFVGGNAVVTRDVEPFWLVGGIPAKPIRKLEVEEIDELKR
jgi:acetyltransferase-like isoleucine patch superfamily enzyme